MKKTTYWCGRCGTEFDTNFALDEVECPECDSRRCEHCGGWSGGSAGLRQDVNDGSPGGDARELPLADRLACTPRIGHLEQQL